MHVVNSKVDGLAKRVVCKTCDGEHNFRPNPPKSTNKRTGARTVAIKDDGRQARPYAYTEQFSVSDVLEHPRYGRGLVVGVRGDKIDVEFPEKVSKTLLHGRDV